MAAGAVAQKLSLHPKAAGNAGEQHTHSVVLPGTSPKPLRSWIHLVVVLKKKKQLYVQGKSKSLCLTGVAACTATSNKGLEEQRASYPPFTAG